MWVGVSAEYEAFLKSQGQPVPQRIELRALVDTGAYNTCISSGVLRRLGMPAIEKFPLLSATTGGDAQMCDAFDVSIAIPLPSVSRRRPTATELRIPAARVVAIELEGTPIDALIGRDLLKRCLLVYDGHSNRFMISF
jgi:hypothetical protein